MAVRPTTTQQTPNGPAATAAPPTNGAHPGAAKANDISRLQAAAAKHRMAAPAAATPQAAAPSPASARVQAPRGMANVELVTDYNRHNEANFLAPTSLAVTQVAPRRIAMVGSCTLVALRLHKSNPSDCKVDFYLANNVAKLEEWPGTPQDEAPYDFQVIQLGLRFVLPDAAFWDVPYAEPDRYDALLKRACKQIDVQLERRMGWNTEHGLLTFVANFPCPQRNPMGALFPRYDLRNPEYFIDRMNEHLEKSVRAYRNAYILDIDRIAQSLGRRYIQDDLLSVVSHNGLHSLFDENNSRIEPIGKMEEYFDIKWPKEFPAAIWAELAAMYRTVRQADAVKLVVVDLDDTLWTGVIGEMTEVDSGVLEGWQLGLVEALLWLKKRGILLAIISKNEESRIREIWSTIFGDMLSLKDFAAVKINWTPKSENMRDILAGVNLLPRNVVFIDDNPAERSAMKQAFPAMRVLGRHPYYLRQTLLWAPETQVVALTEEAASRTEMVQQQLAREDDRRAYSAEDFLRAAAPEVTLRRIDSVDHPRFARAIELINKTNQFNTTGRRWAPSEWGGYFSKRGQMHVFDVKDAYTSYGLVGVVLVQGDVIRQWVMSCRVLGYDIEIGVMAKLVAIMRAAGAKAITAKLRETDANFPCRSLFGKAGFSQTGEDWILPLGASPAIPGHVTFTKES